MTPIASLEKFAGNWRKMADWGNVSRWAAEDHAFSYLSSTSLRADDVSQTLSFSRSTVSASLGVLEECGLITKHHVRSDRRQNHESSKSPWEVFQLILDEPQRGMIDPTLAVFKASLNELARIAPEDFCASDHMRKVVSYFKDKYPLYNELRRLPNDPIQNLNKMAERVGEEIG